MRTENPAFVDYLSRHYAHLGDHARHRAGKKRQLLHTYRRFLPEQRDAQMLEIGPGYGQLLELLRIDLGYARTVAIDVSREVSEFCEQVVPGSTTCVSDTNEYLAQNAGRFERIFALHVLEHVPRAEAEPLVRAICGALRPGGRFLVEVPNMANLFTSGYLRYADLTHETGFAETSLRQLLTAAGLVEVECFEERLAPGGLKELLAGGFRNGARLLQRVLYKGYELPVPRVLSPALAASAMRPHDPA